MNNDKTQAVALIKQFRSGMLITLGMEDRPHARPMMIANVDDDLMMSFVTTLDSLKVDEIRRRSNACITLQSSTAFLALSGYAVVVTDAEEKASAWSPIANLWFQGPADPEAALIRFQPETIEYWDHQGANALRSAFEVARAVASGSAPEMPDGVHGRVTI